MNGSNGYGPYGAPPPAAGAYGAPPAQSYGAPAAQAYGAPAAQAYGQQPQSPYGAAPSPYGAAPGYGPPQPQYPQQGMMGGMPGMGMAQPKNAGLAIGLELGGGSLFQTFGIGHLYAGNVGMGLGLMFGYWALSALNFFLCFIFVGFITWPLTWLAFMIISSITANNAAKRFNARAMGQAY